MSDISIPAQDILKYLVENDKIDVSIVQEEIEMQKKKELLSKHDKKIWKGKDGYFYTYLPKDGGGRHLIKKHTLKEVENIVVKYQRSIIETHRIPEVFEEWAKLKLEYGEIQRQTYDRYKTDFYRFFAGTHIARMDMANIRESDIEYFIKTSIREKELTNKAYSGLRLIILGVFKYAKKKGYTDISITNFMGDIELSSKTFKKKLHTDEESVFTDNEVEKIIDFIQNNETIINLGILLAFQTGLRVGELSALKPSDICGNVLYVNKTEIRYRGDDGNYVFEVREAAKTDAGNRKVILNTDAIDTLHRIRMYNPFGEYLFMQDGLRIKEHSFTIKLYKICDYVGIKRRSLHKVRKTYATKLINGNVDEKIVIRQLGHTDISCTKNYYYFNNKDMDEAREQIEKALVF